MKIIGHRGAAGYVTENTLASFEKAIELGADYIELDVHKTRDDQIIVLHDKSIGGKPIEKLLFSDIKQHLIKKDVDVPTLDEVFERLAGRIGINIEIKSSIPVECMIDKIMQYPYQDKIIVSSFMHECLFVIKQKAPQIEIGVLLDSRKLDAVDCLNTLQSRIIIQRLDYVDKDYVDMVHGADAEIFVWTVNDPEDIQKMISFNVDGIISDFPDRVRVLKGTSG